MNCIRSISRNTLKVLQAMLSQMLLADVFYNYDVNLQIKHLKKHFSTTYSSYSSSVNF